MLFVTVQFIAVSALDFYFCFCFCFCFSLFFCCYFLVSVIVTVASLFRVLVFPSHALFPALSLVVVAFPCVLHPLCLFCLSLPALLSVFPLFCVPSLQSIIETEREILNVPFPPNRRHSSRTISDCYCLIINNTNFPERYHVSQFVVFRIHQVA